jgi:KDO2-lipid IV(A) lauroyltransferase
MWEAIGILTRSPARLDRVRRGALALPQSVAFTIVAAAGNLLFLVARRFRARVVRNMGVLLPDAGWWQRLRMCRRYVVHECLTIYEQAIEYRRSFAPGRQQVQFAIEGGGHLDAALARGTGAIVYLPHVGNFFYPYWKLAQRYPCLSVVTAGSPELRPLFLGFHELGLQALDYDAEPPRMLALKLRQHLRRNGLVFLLGDFSRPSFDACQLFGRPSALPAGAVTLALASGAPIVPLVTWREHWRRHAMRFEAPIALHERFTPAQRPAALRELAAVLERLILQRPDQWLYWFNVHERWTATASSAAAH